eukprot:CAMPEP_0179313980 /NCGR_PEP_ID=MMETSP0797-20121207/54135_1 /TAXON_ID=47934 /ORGANISM="Dinophysis acuminata, Strain DAEP01" /LENGTH=36 /DNA_ID= /DNA_START= /DNA_END= /DNA_ORIENTATION=
MVQQMQDRALSNQGQFRAVWGRCLPSCRRLADEDWG